MRPFGPSPLSLIERERAAYQAGDTAHAAALADVIDGEQAQATIQAESDGYWDALHEIKTRIEELDCAQPLAVEALIGELYELLADY